MNRSILVLAGLLSLAVSDCARAGTLVTNGSPAVRSSAAIAPIATVEDLNLPERFIQRVRDRAVIDLYQKRNHQVAPGIIPTPNQTLPFRYRAGRFVRTVRANLGESVSACRAESTNNVLPLRGFRAPILEDAHDSPPAQRLVSDPSAAEREAAAIIDRRLARDGLLPTLARVIDKLGADRCLTNIQATLVQLTALGFPCDLLGHFQVTEVEGASKAKRPLAIVTLAARRLGQGASLKAVQQELRTLPFDFVPSKPQGIGTDDVVAEVITTGARQADFDVRILNPKFEAATESGEHKLGMLRVQAGGGWRDGVVPGGPIDIIAQLVEVQREAEFLISVFQEIAGPFESMITNSWRLRKTHQVKLCVEPLPVAAWAQDNGKAGMVTVPGAPSRLATLTPRYASIEEGKSIFEPGESYLMDGLHAAGHTVIHSSLLFQGGNTLVVRHPKSGERLLLIGEGEIYRNVSLGLDCAQAIEAFRREFGVDRCVVLPAVSYHLDFDVCLRAHGDGLLAFVNDNRAAVRLILGLGVDALERHGALDAAGARAARDDLDAGRDIDLLRRLTNVVQRLDPVTGGFPASLSRFFVTDTTDDAAGNLQTFLLALDLLEVQLDRDAPPAGDSERVAYLLALRRMSEAQREQAAELKSAGCSVVLVPSMTDLHRGINYLNGIHHRDGYLLPSFSGFYTPLDRAAQTAFRQALGEDFKISAIRSAECQRMHGGVHCAAAAYPIPPAQANER